MYLLDLSFVKLWLHNPYISAEEGQGEMEREGKKVTEATMKSCQLKVMSVQWWNFTTSGYLANGTINSRWNNEKQQLWSEAESLPWCMAFSLHTHVSVQRAPGSMFLPLEHRCLQLLKAAIALPLSPEKRKPVGEAHAPFLDLPLSHFWFLH